MIYDERIIHAADKALDIKLALKNLTFKNFVLLNVKKFAVNPNLTQGFKDLSWERLAYEIEQETKIGRDYLEEFRREVVMTIATTIDLSVEDGETEEETVESFLERIAGEVKAEMDAEKENAGEKLSAESV